MPKIVINEQNLNDFKRWLVQNPAIIGGRGEYEFMVPLGAILYKMPALTINQQKFIASNLPEGNVEDIKTMLDMATKYPHILGHAYMWSGNSRTGHTYWGIQEILKQRPFEQNIPAIYTLLHYGNIYGRDAGLGEISHTTKENAQLLNEMFAPTQNHKIDQIKDNFTNNAKEFFSSLDRTKLLGFDAASPDMREYINGGIITDGYHIRNTKDIVEIVNRLDEKFFTPQLVKDLIRFVGKKPETNHDTSNAKTQAEKNKNILPKHYTKILNAMISMADAREIHDRDNYGKIKTLTRRYKEMMTEWYNTKNWSDIHLNGGLISDAYLRAIATDVNDNMATELDAEDVRALLESDTRGYWARKLPKDIILAARANLNPIQRKIMGTKSDQIFDKHLADNIINGVKITAKEKRDYANSLDAAIAAEAPQRAATANEYSEFKKLQGRLTDSYANIAKLESIEHALQQISTAYTKITRNLIDGLPNAQELNLGRDAIEASIHAGEQIAIPAQKSLPMFVGRAAEKQRREKLNQSIENFNRVLQKIAADKVGLGKYSRHALNSEFLKQAKQLTKDAQQEHDALYRQLGQYRTLSEIENDLKMFDEHAELARYVSHQLAQQTERNKQRAAHQLGHDQIGELTPVTDDMSPEEKRAVRAKNRKTLNDKLAARKNKKPAHNLADMLKDDNER